MGSTLCPFCFEVGSVLYLFLEYVVEFWNGLSVFLRVAFLFRRSSLFLGEGASFRTQVLKMASYHQALFGQGRIRLFGLSSTRSRLQLVSEKIGMWNPRVAVFPLAVLVLQPPKRVPFRAPIFLTHSHVCLRTPSSLGYRSFSI